MVFRVYYFADFCHKFSLILMRKIHNSTIHIVRVWLVVSLRACGLNVLVLDPPLANLPCTPLAPSLWIHHWPPSPAYTTLRPIVVSPVGPPLSSGQAAARLDARLDRIRPWTRPTKLSAYAYAKQCPRDGTNALKHLSRPFNGFYEVFRIW